MKFSVSGSGQFRVFTNAESGESYRIPIRDILLVLKKQGPPPEEGRNVELDNSQIDSLRELHNKWANLGDEAAIKHNETQATLGCISWIIVIAVIAAILWALL